MTKLIKLLSVINMLVLFIGMVLYFIITFMLDINLGTGYKELENILLIALPCFLILLYSFMSKETKNKRKCLLLYLASFVIVMIGFCFSNNRFNILIDEEIMFREYNIIPFHSIINLLSSKLGLKFAIYNIVGNFLMLTPLSILLPMVFDKQKKIGVFSMTIISLCFTIEVIQYITGLGSLDIDDLILNVSGSLILFIVIQNTNVGTFINNFFFKKTFSRRICLIIYTIIILIFGVIFIKRILLINQYYTDKKIDLKNIECISNNKVYLGDVGNYHYYSNCDYGNSYILVGNQKYKIEDFIHSSHFNNKYLRQLNLERSEIITNAILSGEEDNIKVKLYNDEFQTIYLYGFNNFFIEKEKIIYNVKTELEHKNINISFIHDLVKLNFLDNVNGYSIETGKYYNILTCGESYSTYNDFYILDTQFKITKDTCNQFKMNN